MPLVTLKKACELTSKSKRTIQRYMANGKLSYKTNKLGHKVIDVAELARVFDNLSPPMTPQKRPDDTPTMSPHENDVRVDKLLAAVELLEKVVSKQSEQIASLLQLEHKPVNEPKHNIKTTKNQPEHLKPSNISPQAKMIPPTNNGYAAAHGLPNVITEELHKKIMELSGQGLSSRKIAEAVPVSKATINRVINISK